MYNELKIKDLKPGDYVNLVLSYDERFDGDKMEIDPTEEVTCKILDVYTEDFHSIKRDFAKVKAYGWDYPENLSISDKDLWQKIESSPKQHNRPKHYGAGATDLIDYWCERYTPEELRGAFKAQLSKYNDRLGYKDDEISELTKIIDYATRYRDWLEGGK
ncbi:DUF3310 domain-containing protein [Staphylococcus chromogenes]|uniref:DUF3310 domain-containing protein n=1 Tax=Staphylococcus chromogenes TaxID=46126 RepID=UPI00188F3813|nr:DUF3310 domain-containing protein [Staphylococcus chromogenes]